MNHPTFIHELVWWERTALTPLEMSLAGLKTDDAALIASCKSLYRFCAALLEDMYQHPDAYYLNAGEYEAFLNGRSEYEARREDTKKHNSARSKCYHLTGFHQLFLMEVSRCGTVVGDGLVVSAADYEAVVKQAGKSPYLNDVGVQTRLAALSRQGLAVRRDGANVVLTCPTAPDMFLAMTRLGRAGRNDKTFGPLNFKCCNFQQIERPYVPDFAIVSRVLNDDMARRAHRLHDYAAQFKMTPKCYVIWKMRYAYKGLAAFRFIVLYGSYEVHVPYGMNARELACFDEVLSRQPKDVQAFALKHINVCRNCGYCQNVTGHPDGWRLAGQERPTCGLPALRICDPSEEQIEYIEKFIGLRMETIRAVKCSCIEEQE